MDKKKLIFLFFQFFLIKSLLFINGVESNSEINSDQLIYPSPFFPYFSQVGQDKFLNEEIFKNKEHGVFIDIGAHDGISYSNSYYFERNLKWNGICIEPNPIVFEKLKRNRICKTINGCIYKWNGSVDFLVVKGPAEMLSGIFSEYDKKHLRRINLEIKQRGGSKEIKKIKSFILDDLLSENNIGDVDLLTIDTEGSELNILKTIDFSKRRFSVICVENNYNDGSVEAFLKSQGFSLFKTISSDLFFINSN